MIDLISGRTNKALHDKMFNKNHMKYLKKSIKKLLKMNVIEYFEINKFKALLYLSIITETTTSNLNWKFLITYIICKSC